MKSLIAALWDKMAIWKKSRMKPQYNVDYVLLESDDNKKTGVGIKKGKFAGVLYHYGKAKIQEDDGFAKMTFSYTVVQSPTIPIHELMEDEEFHDFIGEILTEILISQAEANEKARNDDSEEFDIQ